MGNVVGHLYYKYICFINDTRIIICKIDTHFGTANLTDQANRLRTQLSLSFSFEVNGSVLFVINELVEVARKTIATFWSDLLE